VPGHGEKEVMGNIEPSSSLASLSATGLSQVIDRLGCPSIPPSAKAARPRPEGADGGIRVANGMTSAIDDESRQPAAMQYSCSDNAVWLGVVGALTAVELNPTSTVVPPNPASASCTDPRPLIWATT
jgi:hypothetical protein